MPTYKVLVRRERVTEGYVYVDLDGGPHDDNILSAAEAAAEDGPLDEEDLLDTFVEAMQVVSGAVPHAA